MRIDNNRLTEKELVNRSQNGDIGAFAQLVKNYSIGMVTFINRMIPSKEDAEDISQEVFIKAYRVINQFKGNSSFKTWLYAIAKNTSYSYLEKKHPRIISLDQRDGLIDTISINYPDSMVDSVVIQEDFLNTIKKKMAELPPKYNIIIQLYYYQQFKYEEIAEILQIPVGTVKTHLFRALRMLRKEVLKTLEKGTIS